MEKEEEKNLTKEEILAISRKENKNGDEREKQYLYKAAFTATAIGFILYGIISVVLAVLDKKSYEMNAVFFAMIGSMYFMFGLKATKRRPLYLAAGCVCIAASVVALVLWILGLCGVM